MYVDGHGKTLFCVELLKSVPGKTIIFVNNPSDVELHDGTLQCLSQTMHFSTASSTVSMRSSSRVQDVAVETACEVDAHNAHTAVSVCHQQRPEGPLAAARASMDGRDIAESLERFV